MVSQSQDWRCARTYVHTKEKTLRLDLDRTYRKTKRLGTYRSRIQSLVCLFFCWIRNQSSIDRFAASWSRLIHMCGTTKWLLISRCFGCHTMNEYKSYRVPRAWYRSGSFPFSILSTHNLAKTLSCGMWQDKRKSILWVRPFNQQRLTAAQFTACGPIEWRNLLFSLYLFLSSPTYIFDHVGGTVKR